MKTAELDRFVLQHRPAKNRLDPYRAYASMWEEERDSSGALASTAVVFITNRECPFRCVMCDLWVNTLDESVPRGAIADADRWRARPPAAGAADQAVQRRQLLRSRRDSS